MNTFSTKEALAFGWKTTKENFWFLVGLMLLVFVISLIPDMLIKILDVKDSAGSSLLNIIGWILGGFLQLGTLKILLEFVDGKKPSYSLLWSQSHLLLRYLAASVLVGVAVMIGMVLLIVPGIIIALMFMLYSYFIVDKGAGVTQSIKMSMKATAGHRWQLFGFALLCLLLNFVGALLLGVGLLVAIPTTMLASTYIYRKLVQPDELVIAAPVAPVPAA